MADLYRVDSPIKRDQRNNLNLTFEDILNRFNNLQRQINILAGDNDVDELINRIADALNNSESTLEDLQTALTSAQQEISAIITATTNAINATDAANQATTDATQLFNDMTVLQTDLEQLQTSLNQVITDATQATTATNTATNNANQATQNAKQATTDADNAASRASDAAESIEGWGQAVPFQVGTYHRNNVVTFEGSTYQSLIDDNTSLPTDNSKWIVLARKGLDGLGAVQTVNDKSPDGEGNVEVGISDIDGLQVALNEKAQDVDLASLEETFMQHSNNGDIHVTQVEQDIWDRYTSQSAIVNAQGTNKSPSDYRTLSNATKGKTEAGGSVFREFNNKTSIPDLPEQYGYLETTIPWVNTNGGQASQLLISRNGEQWRRYETSEGSNVWGTWGKYIASANGKARTEYNLYTGSAESGMFILNVNSGFPNLKSYDEVIVFGILNNGGAFTFARQTHVIIPSLITDVYAGNFSHTISFLNGNTSDLYWMRYTVNLLGNRLDINYNRSTVAGVTTDNAGQNYITRIVGVKYA